jgi:hypothetical protein
MAQIRIKCKVRNLGCFETDSKVEPAGQLSRLRPSPAVKQGPHGTVSKYNEVSWDIAAMKRKAFACKASRRMSLS